MPVYTLTTTAGTLTPQTKASLAGEIGRIHSEINQVPAAYVNVVYLELPADNVFTGGTPAAPVLVSGWVRDGHDEEATSRLALQIAGAVAEFAALPKERVVVVFQSSPARFAVEGGRLLPDPGQEAAWMAAAAEQGAG
ncbi:tautomerase family protein [Mycolicibacterium sp.]|uniref:tautomerase family protein n=1 Tax=Mycolicibacterium sp. TaxID=2320850 RepID=UPI003D10CB01